MKAMKASERIEAIAQQQNGYLAAKDLTNNRISGKHLATMVQKGRLEKIRRGMYRLTYIDFSEFESFLEVTQTIPKAVICLLSALDYHTLSTVNPGGVYIAVPNKTKVIAPAYTPVQVHYLAPKQYEGGIEIVTIRGVAVKIYNQEKTVCQMFQFRNKYGLDLALEALKKYMQSRSRDISKLRKYACECRVEKLLKNYLEVLI